MKPPWNSGHRPQCWGQPGEFLRLGKFLRLILTVGGCFFHSLSTTFPRIVAAPWLSWEKSEILFDDR